MDFQDVSTAKTSILVPGATKKRIAFFSWMGKRNLRNDKQRLSHFGMNVWNMNIVFSLGEEELAKLYTKCFGQRNQYMEYECGLFFGVGRNLPNNMSSVLNYGMNMKNKMYVLYTVFPFPTYSLT